MKKYEELNEKIILWTAVALLALGALLVTMIIGTTIDASHQAQTYDLNCLTEMNEKPLENCRK